MRLCMGRYFRRLHTCTFVNYQPTCALRVSDEFGAVHGQVSGQQNPLIAEVSQLLVGVQSDNSSNTFLSASRYRSLSRSFENGVGTILLGRAFSGSITITNSSRVCLNRTRHRAAGVF